MKFNENMTWKEKGKTKWHYNEDFVKFLKEVSKKPFSIKKLCKEIHMGRNALNRILNENNIKLKPNKCDANFKAIYQNYDWCYQKFMMEGLNHEEMAKKANCTKRVIEKWCTEKHRLTQKYRQIHKKLNKIQNDLLIGCMLGDGHIDKRETQPMFIISHAEDQKDYLYWKYNILKDLCNIAPVEKPKSIRYFQNDKGYFCQKQHRFCTRIYGCLKEYRAMTYGELLEKMNEFSLSVWTLDDGYRSSSNWQLCIADYSQDEIELAIKLLKERFNINSYQQKDKRYINFDADSSRLLDEIILKNIPNDLDVVQNKIINNDISEPQKFIMINVNGESTKFVDYCRENKLNYKRILGRTYRGLDIYKSIKLERKKDIDG